MNNIQNLDKILFSKVRLSIMSYLFFNGKTDFKTLLNFTQTTKGNLSSNLQKLKKHNMIQIIKTYENKRSYTIIKPTNTGLKAFEEYRKYLLALLTNNPKPE